MSAWAIAFGVASTTSVGLAIAVAVQSVRIGRADSAATKAQAACNEQAAAARAANEQLRKTAREYAAHRRRTEAQLTAAQQEITRVENLWMETVSDDGVVDLLDGLARVSKTLARDGGPGPSSDRAAHMPDGTATAAPGGGDAGSATR